MKTKILTSLVILMSVLASSVLGLQSQVGKNASHGVIKGQLLGIQKLTRNRVTYYVDDGWCESLPPWMCGGWL